MENNNIDYILEEKAINLKISYLQKSNFTTLMTTSNTCCIMLCEKGSCHLTLKQNQYEIKPKTLLYTYLPFSVSKEDISNDFKAIYITYNHLTSDNIGVFKYISPYIFVMLENPVVELTEKKFEWLMSFCEIIRRKQEIEDDNIAKEAFNRTMMVTLLVEVRNIYKDLSIKNNISPNDVRYTRSVQITKDFFNLLMQHFTIHRDIRFYAEKMCISPKHLSSSLKKTTGQTCNKFIGNIVVMEAKQQLLSTNKTVQQIAFDLSFPNASFFGKFFKKNTGISPNAFRSQHEKIVKKV
ncbi:MAG: helix-turn-helix domain-containing protein [Bacteroidales bacterium]|nr:helix-turn-helix domain-containing protein [Bacteroidales bacterium]MBR6309725.1 AraC family transcriptional regulator [Paludibacteraceae bacterium]MDD6357466.1 helix-turn-helix domain-containing protein [Bacteroidales bacterium]